MIKEIPLDLILPNPFQTRKSEDPEHIKNLALSIAKNGLMQVPSARVLVGAGKVLDADSLLNITAQRIVLGELTVQLAFGHSRLAAYKYIRDVKHLDIAALRASTNGTSDWMTMPLNIIELDDQQMFEQAVSENLDRKDLSPIEEAQAMEVYRGTFKKTSKQVGELFHLSDSAVRNKIRLLDLPEEIKKEAQEGRINESNARELLTFYSMPEDTQKHWPEIIEGAKNGNDINQSITRMVRYSGKELDRKQWKHTDEFKGEGIVGICKGCEFIFRRDNKDFCINTVCFAAKNGNMEPAIYGSGKPAQWDSPAGRGKDRQRRFYVFRVWR